MNNISFNGSYLIKGDNGMGLNSLKSNLKGGCLNSSYSAKVGENTLYLTGQEAKDREQMAKASKSVYKSSTPDEVDSAINKSFAQNALKVDLSEMRIWPRSENITPGIYKKEGGTLIID